jgi:hypothetical protein
MFWQGWEGTGGTNDQLLLFQHTGDNFAMVTPPPNFLQPSSGITSATYSTDGNFIFVQEYIINTLSVSPSSQYGYQKLTTYKNHGSTITYASTIMTSYTPGNSSMTGSFIVHVYRDEAS